jgi:hypothetical protein
MTYIPITHNQNFEIKEKMKDGQEQSLIPQSIPS